MEVREETGAVLETAQFGLVHFHYFLSYHTWTRICLLSFALMWSMLVWSKSRLAYVSYRRMRGRGRGRGRGWGNRGFRGRHTRGPHPSHSSIAEMPPVITHCCKDGDPLGALASCDHGEWLMWVTVFKQHCLVTEVCLHIFLMCIQILTERNQLLSPELVAWLCLLNRWAQLWAPWWPTTAPWVRVKVMKNQRVSLPPSSTWTEVLKDHPLWI